MQLCQNKIYRVVVASALIGELLEYRTKLRLIWHEASNFCLARDSEVRNCGLESEALAQLEEELFLS